MFKKILIANRGEIAVRVIRTCRDLGIRSVAVFSEADREALHVRFADEAYLIGASAPRESYLNVARLVEAIRASGADAVHPGYGFLSENADFARAVAAAGAKFIGPSPEAIAAMGSKTGARQLMMAAGVPVVPGGSEAVADVDAARAEAARVGYPVLLKARSGGGGRGMRVVRGDAELAAAFASGTREAASAFGDGGIYVEKYFGTPKHVEVQVLADSFGETVHLFERDCSVQRRHQKVIEESPCAVVDDEARRAIGDIAVRAAKAVKYEGAGTVEFLFVPDETGCSGKFYFLEMNTRIQVEHPVTEMITGLDLVAEQIRVAAGERLGYRQGDVVRRGAAVECRIYAEDPDKNFLPSPGKIAKWRAPAGPNVREDAGVYAGVTVSSHYDAMLAKCVAWGPTRDAAIARMRRALEEYAILGVKTNVGFLKRVLAHAAFLSGRYDTGLIETMKGVNGSFEDHSRIALGVAVASAHLKAEEEAAKLFHRNGANGAAACRWRAAGREESMRKEGR